MIKIISSLIPRYPFTKQLMEEKQNIKVVIRIRPLLCKEIIAKTNKRESLAFSALNTLDNDGPSQSETLACVDNNLLLFDPKKKASEKKQFRFDSVLDSKCSQRDVFETSAKHLISKIY